MLNFDFNISIVGLVKKELFLSLLKVLCFSAVGSFKELRQFKVMSGLVASDQSPL